jgi:gliding motility-associated-like protein
MKILNYLKPFSLWMRRGLEMRRQKGLRAAFGLAAISSLFFPSVANAKLEVQNWWGANSPSVTTVDACGVVYKMAFAMENNGQAMLTLDGVNLNATNTTIQTGLSYTWKVGDDGKTYALQYTGTSASVSLYLSTAGSKYAITDTVPSYPARVGIDGLNYQSISTTTLPSFSSYYCVSPAATVPAASTYQWQMKALGAAAWSDIAGAASDTYKPAATINDSTLFRMVLLNGTDSLKSNALAVTYALPTSAIKVTCPDASFNRYEYELDYGHAFTVAVGPTFGMINNLKYILQVRNNNTENFRDSISQSSPDSIFTIAPSSNMEYKVIVSGSDLRPGRAGQSLRVVVDSFFVRVRYKWNSASDSIVSLWSNDFGNFTDASTYIMDTLNVATGKLDVVTFKNQMPITNGGVTTNEKILEFWAPDFYSSVRGHEYATHNPNLPYTWCPDKKGYRVEDGYYAILDNPELCAGCTNGDYWRGEDHTEGDVNGGMLMINCKSNSKNSVVFERTITLSSSCDNSQLLFTAYVNNATAKATNKPVNVLLQITGTDAAGNSISYSIPSGNINPRVSGGDWANLSYKFPAKSGTYTLRLINNQEGGSEAANWGNDLLFDDISITAAYPRIYLSGKTMVTDTNKITTCAEKAVALYAVNENDIKSYISKPLYLYQYSKDGGKTWNTIGAITDKDSLVVSLTRKAVDKAFWGKTDFRTIVASDSSALDSLMAGKNPGVLSCDNVYAISNSFHITFGFMGPMADVLDTVCAGSEIVMKAVPGDNHPTYHWNEDTTNKTNSMSFTPAYDAKAAYPKDTVFHFIAVENLLGCTDTQLVKVHVRGLVKFTGTDVVACENGTLALSGVSPASVSLAWTIDGNASLSKVDASTYKVIGGAGNSMDKGNVVVKGSALDFCGMSDTFAYQINKPIKLTMTADRTDNLFCLADGSTIKMTANTVSGNPVNYVWYADGKQAGTTTSPVNTYSFPITEGRHLYDVKVTDGVCNLAGSEAAASDTIEARQPMLIAMDEVSNICEGSSVNLKMSLKNVLTNPTSVAWSVDGGTGSFASASTATDASSASTNVFTPVSSGNTTETLTISAKANDKVCPANGTVTAKVSFKLFKNLKISLSAPDVVGGKKCMNNASDESVNLVVNVEKGEPSSFAWSDGTTTTEPKNIYALKVGDNVISVTAEDGVCSSSTADAKSELTIRARKPISITLTQSVGSNPACVGSVIELSANVLNSMAGAKTKLEWSATPTSWTSTSEVDNGSAKVNFTPAVGDNDITVVASESDADPVCAAETASYKLAAQDSVRLKMQSEGSFCQANDGSTFPLVVDITNGNPSKLVWSTGDETSSIDKESTLKVSPTSDTQYWVYAVDAVCANSDKVYTTIKVSTMFDLNLEAESEEVEMDSAVRLTVTPSSSYKGNYTWLMDNEQQSVGPDVNYQKILNDEGTYTFVASADGGICGTIFSNEVDIDVADFKPVPNAFTPGNGNAKNDVFMRGYKVEIFNRYQQLVYEGNNGWDGSYNGSSADPGTYFYRLWKKDGRELKGTIELVKF